MAVCSSVPDAGDRTADADDADAIPSALGYTSSSIFSVLVRTGTAEAGSILPASLHAGTAEAEAGSILSVLAHTGSADADSSPPAWARTGAAKTGSILLALGRTGTAGTAEACASAVHCSERCDVPAMRHHLQAWRWACRHKSAEARQPHRRLRNVLRSFSSNIRRGNPGNTEEETPSPLFSLVADTCHHGSSHSHSSLLCTAAGQRQQSSHRTEWKGRACCLSLHHPAFGRQSQTTAQALPLHHLLQAGLQRQCASPWRDTSAPPAGPAPAS